MGYRFVADLKFKRGMNGQMDISSHGTNAQLLYGEAELLSLKAQCKVRHT